MSQQSVDKREVSIDECLIVSNDQKTKKDIPDIITDLYYYESILNETVRAQILYVDTGKSIQKGNSLLSLVEGMPLEKEEDVKIRINDGRKNIITMEMNIQNINIISKDSKGSVVGLDLVSSEGILNFKSVVKKRYDGKISEHIKNILTDKDLLGTKKKLDIEETQNNLNFFGNQKRPFYHLMWLSKKSVPKIPNSDGNTAGFVFFETSDGFKFKSIDGLLSETDPGGAKKTIKSYAMSDTPNLPAGYSGKILDLVPPNPSGDAQKKLESGAYSTRTILFDPFNCYYEIVNPNFQGGGLGDEKNLQKAGKNLPKGNPKFIREGNNKDFSRTQYYLLDKGTMPTGTGTGKGQDQVVKSKEQNFDPKNILNQSSMRYNQLFSSQTEITIDADFSLHAGDLIWIHPPELSNKDNQEYDQKLGGYYLIAELCHYINISEGGYTKIIAVRDSTGAKGNPIGRYNV